MSDEGKERRRFERIPSDMELRFSESGNDKSFVGKLINLNGTGVCFLSEHNIEPGTDVEVATMDEGTVVPILDGVIKVVRSIEKDGQFEIAGEFIDLKS